MNLTGREARAARRALHLRQSEVAKRAGLSRGTVARFELNIRGGNLTSGSIEKIFRVLTAERVRQSAGHLERACALLEISALGAVA